MLQADAEDMGLGKAWPTEFYTGTAGLPLIKAGQKDLSAYYNHLKPADETWLLGQFLDHVYPEGGIIFLSNPERLPDDMKKENFWKRLQQ